MSLEDIYQKTKYLDLARDISERENDVTSSKLLNIECGVNLELHLNSDNAISRDHEYNFRAVVGEKLDNRHNSVGTAATRRTKRSGSWP